MYIYDTSPLEEEVIGTATVSVSAYFSEPYCEYADLPWDKIDAEIMEAINSEDAFDVTIDSDCEGFSAELEFQVSGTQIRIPSCDEYVPDDHETEWSMEDVEDYAQNVRNDLQELGYTRIRVTVSEP